MNNNWIYRIRNRCGIFDPSDRKECMNLHSDFLRRGLKSLYGTRHAHDSLKSRHNLMKLQLKLGLSSIQPHERRRWLFQTISS